MEIPEEIEISEEMKILLKKKHFVEKIMLQFQMNPGRSVPEIFRFFDFEYEYGNNFYGPIIEKNIFVDEVLGIMLKRKLDKFSIKNPKFKKVVSSWLYAINQYKNIANIWRH